MKAPTSVTEDAAAARAATRAPGPFESGLREIGDLTVQQEIDALESEAVDPIRYIVGTRVLAVALFVPIGAAIALIGQFLGDYLLGVVILNAVPSELLQRLQWFSQGPSDQVY